MGVDEGERVDAVNLEKVDHVVILMLENRSFDHMLGYLSLTSKRPDIDGLRAGFANEYQGRVYPVHHLGTTALDVDPDHAADAVDEQVAGGSMGGFVANAAATLAGRGVEDGDPACVMGYYDGADVPVYDHLAEEFAVCDRWFSSVPGATLPNRLYALCGVAAGSRDDRPPHVPPQVVDRSEYVVVHRPVLRSVGPWGLLAILSSAARSVHQASAQVTRAGQRSRWRGFPGGSAA